ncbi:tail tube TT1 domain-containing protein [Staphylococcus pseudoxylosus]|uniref:tail tube TT1 domain-containing protein n=1 Tax=Staphylococcus pseudoxylosus TaxID=2282419 RepID=UPI002DBB0A35|nr:phage tail protein [Staphylococcus pseudoxylosus]MEB7753279.1 phage tail protein [Staphylococcus pseudoxylosus]
MALILKDLNDKAYPVEAVTNHTTKMNSDGMLTFTIYENSQTKDFINDIAKLWRVENVTGKSDSQVYVVVIAKRKALKDKRTVEITAKEEQFDYLETHRLYENVTGSRTADDFFNMIFKDTPYSFVLLNHSDAVEWENAGDGQTKFAMFLKALQRYGYEFQYEPASKNFKLGERISRRPTYYISKRLNANDISFEEDATSFYTYIRGYGDYAGEDNMHEANLTREYPENAKSPMIKLFGIREAEPLTNGNITKKATMDAKLKQTVEESLKLSIEFDFVALGRNYPFAQPEIGDEIPVIDETINFNRLLRIQEIKTTRDAHHKVIKQSIVVGDPKRAVRYQQKQAGAISDMNDLTAGRSKIRESVLPRAINEATEMLQKTSTELSFSEQGIMAVDKDNPNYVTLLNSSGLGVSKDGGKTFHNAITRGAINASLITAGALNADYIRGGTLDANLVEVVGGKNSDKYVSIVNDELRLSGTFERTWQGNTTVDNVFTSLKNGYLRFRNNETDSSIYMSHFGLSTFRDQFGDYVGSEGRASGTIMFWDKSFSPSGANGITINSYGGVAALTSSNNRTLIGSKKSVNLQSTEGTLMFQPRMAQAPDTGFVMTLASSGGSFPHGYLMYGGVRGESEQVAYSAGLRYERNFPRLSVVDSNFSTGGNTRIESGYGEFNTVTRRGGNQYLNIVDPNVFKVGSDGSDRVASMTVYNRTYSGSANVYITSSGTLGRSTSARKYKINIENQLRDSEKQYQHSSQLLDLDIRSWYDKAEAETYAKECEMQESFCDDNFKLQRHVGLIAEEVGEAGLDEHVVRNENGEVEGIEYDRLWVHLIPIIKDQQKRIEQLEGLENERR